MLHDINLAWAVEVSFPQFGARLEEYVETKPAMTTFRACQSISTVTAMASLPAEVVAIIEVHLKEIVYRAKLHQWHRAQRCLEDKCNYRDHFTRSELIAAITECKDETSLETFGMQKHQLYVSDFLNDFIVDYQGKFVICQEVSLASTQKGQEIS